jgi:cholesterol oxidase
MSKLVRVDLLPDKQDPSGIVLDLWRYPGTKAEPGHKARKPVLLLHGASGNHRTFMEPHGGLAEWLARDFDPWLLDWRGSGLVVDNNEKAVSENGKAFNFNLAAKHDVRRAIKTIREKTGNEKRVAALGFCMGSAILAEAVALGHISHADVDCVVLMTLGLFYETAIDGRLKSDDRILERLRHQRRDEDRFVRVDPRVAKSGTSLREPWPSDLERMYSDWPRALKSHEDGPRDAAPPQLNPVNHMCNRLSFMYGMPYHHHNLVDAIHAEAGSGTPLLEEMFGAIPVEMYLHGARNIRKRQATYFERTPGADDAKFVSDAAREQFRKLEKVTLITGALNRLWHRDSIDRMFEWLTRGKAGYLPQFQKHILPEYGHQDLLWGRHSSTEVFCKIKDGLSV